MYDLPALDLYVSFSNKAELDFTGDKINLCNLIARFALFFIMLVMVFTFRNKLCITPYISCHV